MCIRDRQRRGQFYSLVPVYVQGIFTDVRALDEISVFMSRCVNLFHQMQMGVRVMDSNDQERERGITILAKVGEMTHR